MDIRQYVLLNLFLRMVIDEEISVRIKEIKLRNPKYGFILYSDLGSNYYSNEFRIYLYDIIIISSNSKIRNY